MLEKLDNSVFNNDDIFSHDVDSNFITFLGDDMGFNTIDLNNTKLYEGDNNFDEEDSETLINVRLITCPDTFKQHRTRKKEKSKKMMHVAQHSTRW